MMRAVFAYCCAVNSQNQPSEQEYYSHGSTASKPWDILRVRNISKLEFAQLVSKGIPVVVEDAVSMSGMDLLENMNCEQFSNTFGGAHMRQEYNGNNPNDVNTQAIGDLAWTEHLVASGVPVGVDGPMAAPFYWGIKDAAAEDDLSMKDRPMLELLREKYIKVPYFMDEDNIDILESTPEMWMGANGTGAKAHMDSHCQSTIAIQLSGKRRWRIGAIPAGVRRSEEELFWDGSVYESEAGWVPTYTFTISAGQALVFPPGFIHETINIGGTCAVSLTHQFERPWPAIYYRTFWPHIRRVGDLHECWSTVKMLATFGLGRPTDREKGLRMGTNIGKQIDKNHDGMIDRKEMQPLKMLRRMEFVSESADRLSWGADAVLGYHDQDGDGALTVAEFAEGFSQWAATEKSVQNERLVYQEEARRGGAGAGRDKSNEEL